MSARRVAHLIETDVLGGAERMLVHLAGALPTQGWTSVAFLPRGHDGWLTRALEAVGVSVEHYHLPRPFSPAFARELARTLQRHQITVAHSHEFTMAFYGAWAARQAGIPHVFTMHGGRYYANRLRRRLALRARVTSGSPGRASRRFRTASLPSHRHALRCAKSSGSPLAPS